MLALVAPLFLGPKSGKKMMRRSTKTLKVMCSEFPAFLPKEVENIKDTFALKLASRIERVPVNLSLSNYCVMSSCVMPTRLNDSSPIVLLHGFDSSCLEWRYVFPMLEDADLETWAIDVLGWGFSDPEMLPPCDVELKRDHLYQFWKSYIKRPMILVGPSLGAAIAIDFTLKYPEAVEKLVFIDASVYTEGTGNLATLPKSVAYAGVYLLRSIPLRLYAVWLVFNDVDWDTLLDWTNIGRVHCLLPGWADANVEFMRSGGYNVVADIKQVFQETLVIWGEDDKIIDYKDGVRLCCELPNAILRPIPNCGHIPHVEKPDIVCKLIAEFARDQNGIPSRRRPAPVEVV